MIRLEPRSQPSGLYSALSPILAIGLTLLFAAILMLFMGKPVFKSLEVLFFSPFGDAYSRSELLVKAIPLALIGAGLAVCFRANVWNIGAAGQYTLGAIFGGWVALAIGPDASSPAWLALYLAAGALGGALWGAIPALLRNRFQASEILTSLMLTYVASLLLDFLVRGPWKDPRAYGFPTTPDFPEGVVMPVLVSGTRLHLGLVFAIIAGLALGFMMLRTLRGFSIRAIGSAPRAGAFGGFSQAGSIWFAMLLSGGLAGLAGAVEASATIGKLQPEIAAGYGFTAIIVAFLGRLNPIGSLIAAVILAVSYIGGENAQIALQMPKNVASVFQGVLLFFLLGCDTLIHYRLRFGAAAKA